MAKMKSVLNASFITFLILSLQFALFSQHTEQRSLPTYRLIFSTQYDKKRERPSYIERFVSELNEAGSKGYRVVATLGSEAILILDEGKYEYRSIDTKSEVHFAKGEFWRRLEEMNEQDFRLVNQTLLWSLCEPIDYERAYLEKCQYHDRFLFEKEATSKNSDAQVVVNAFPGWGAKPSEEMSAEIEKKLSDGFYPAHVISPFEVVLNKVRSDDELSKDRPDVMVVRSGWGSNDVRKKVDELGKSGYRLAMTNHRIAVLSRNAETKGIPVRYLWLNANKKSFDGDLALLQQRGVRYATNYPDGQGRRNVLIFDQNVDGRGTQSEFKTLSFEFAEAEDKASGIVTITLKPQSNVAVNQMNQLASQGYRVRDMFLRKNQTVSVLLERTINRPSVGH